MGGALLRHPYCYLHGVDAPGHWRQHGSQHRFATSFGTTHGVAYASCKLMPLRHVNTDVFVRTPRVVRALLREHEW